MSKNEKLRGEAFKIYLVNKQVAVGTRKPRISTKHLAFFKQCLNNYRRKEVMQEVAQLNQFDEELYKVHPTLFILPSLIR